MISKKVSGTTTFPENGTFNNRYFSNGYFLALINGIYHRIFRIYLIIYLFGSELILIFTNPKCITLSNDFRFFSPDDLDILLSDLEPGLILALLLNGPIFAMRFKNIISFYSPLGYSQCSGGQHLEGLTTIVVRASFYITS